MQERSADVAWSTERLLALAVLLLLLFFVSSIVGAGYLGFLYSRTAQRFASFREWYAGLHSRRLVKGLSRSQLGSRVVARPPQRPGTAPTELAPLPVEPPPLPTLRSEGVPPLQRNSAPPTSPPIELDWSDSRLMTTRFRDDDDEPEG